VWRRIGIRAKAAKQQNSKAAKRQSGKAAKRQSGSESIHWSVNMGKKRKGDAGAGGVEPANEVAEAAVPRDWDGRFVAGMVAIDPQSLMTPRHRRGGFLRSDCTWRD
jgi:hypothetical protein